MSGKNVGLDSQCFSYLLDALSNLQEPTDALAEERKALVRIWFYRDVFYLSETVVSECARIRQIDRRELHENWRQVLFLDPPIQNRAEVDARTSYLLQFHPKENDCRVLAEAEDIGLDALLTYDRNFRNRLGSKSGTVKVTSPSEYWASLGVLKGAQPRMVPRYDNPLSKQSWWVW